MISSVFILDKLRDDLKDDVQNTPALTQPEIRSHFPAQRTAQQHKDGKQLQNFTFPQNLSHLNSNVIYDNSVSNSMAQRPIKGQGLPADCWSDVDFNRRKN